MPEPTEYSKLIADVREQVLYMQELGIDMLEVQLPEATVPDERPRIATPAPVQEFAKSVKTLPPPDLQLPERAETKPREKRAPGSRIAALPSLAKRPAKTSPSYETAKSIIAITSDNSEISETSQEMTQTSPLETPARATADTIESIRAEIGNCTRCPLHTGRTQVVHSTGNFEAELMFVGEAPGADEDAQGVPFVGRAGQLLTKIIESIGLRREDVCIGNINRCRPPGNRQPFPDEAAVCRPFLLREIGVIKPRVIVVLGAHAAHNLLQVKTPISKLRGHFHDYFGVKVMPTFHP
ncbi:MAG: uracil-DNA glycosylase, partial [Pyrinomonadaceae bacterium]|nr:uracil-DNA glycosylase [Pyrinomonadaceae bacterium]